jgi:metal-sulfur cluster biosynthetic enzyme
MTLDEVWKALEEVEDPELGYSITKLGLVNRVAFEGSRLKIDFTLTSLGCPLAEELAEGIETVIRRLDKDVDLDLNLVWDPPWDEKKVDEEIRLELGLL